MKELTFLKRTALSVLACCVAVCAAGCNQTQEAATETVETAELVEEEVVHELNPHYTDETNPENFGVEWDIMADDAIVESFEREDKISFGDPDDYFELKGVSTFRGNNYRNDAVYGTTDLDEKKLNIEWEKSTGSKGEWSGCGWTGQPLLVRWDKDTIEHMNIFPDKKEKKGLVEVIYATLDGNIYFFDIDDGSATREPINVGMTFKGTGTLDPRGYPIMYIGSGIASGGKAQSMFIISLIDGKILYEQSGSDSFAPRAWYAFDSSPIVDAKTDTLIWPGENGALYTLKINSKYDKETGSVEVAPEVIAKTRYRTTKSKTGNYWNGYECSGVIVDRYLYLSENGGMFFCINLDTMELVWAQDTLDDSNSTPVFEWDDEGNPYVYTAPSLHWTASGGKGSVNIFKLDANTGEIQWKMPFDCYTIPNTSGGVQASPVLGREGTDLEGIIVYPVAYTPHQQDGMLVAINTKTGEKVWEHHMPYYTWSSPVAVYNSSGEACVIVCDSIGDVNLIDGKTGELLDKVNIGANVEASPSVYKDMLVVGTRGCRICGISIK